MFFKTKTVGFKYWTEFVETTSESVEVQTSLIKKPGKCLKREMGGVQRSQELTQFFDC
jgi:hypothetical protein